MTLRMMILFISSSAAAISVIIECISLNAPMHSSFEISLLYDLRMTVFPNVETKNENAEMICSSEKCLDGRIDEEETNCSISE